MKQSENRYRQLQLFTGSGSLEFVAMDILRPLAKMPIGSQLMLVMMDRYLAVTKYVPTSKITALCITSLFMKPCVILYGFPGLVRTGCGTQFINKLFDSLCGLSGTKHLTATVYHSQANGASLSV